VENAAREEHVFIVRTWREAPAASGGWRLSVLHVGSGMRLASSQIRDIDDFIRLRMERDANSPTE
jgi:hypothetical protein